MNEGAVSSGGWSGNPMARARVSPFCGLRRPQKDSLSVGCGLRSCRAHLERLVVRRPTWVFMPNFGRVHAEQADEVVFLDIGKQEVDAKAAADPGSVWVLECGWLTR